MLQRQQGITSKIWKVYVCIPMCAARVTLYGMVRVEFMERRLARDMKKATEQFMLSFWKKNIPGIGNIIFT